MTQHIMRIINCYRYFHIYHYTNEELMSKNQRYKKGTVRDITVDGPSLVYVDWIDSCSSGRWQPVSEFDVNTTSIRCASIGWILYQNAETLTIASHCAGDDHKGPPYQANGAMTI